MSKINKIDSELQRKVNHVINYSTSMYVSMRKRYMREILEEYTPKTMRNAFGEEYLLSHRDTPEFSHRSEQEEQNREVSYSEMKDNGLRWTLMCGAKEKEVRQGVNYFKSEAYYEECGGKDRYGELNNKEKDEIRLKYTILINIEIIDISVDTGLNMSRFLVDSKRKHK